MIGAALFGIFLTPMLYVVFQRLRERFAPEREPPKVEPAAEARPAP